MNPLQARLSQIRRFARSVYAPHKLALRQGVPEVLRALTVAPAAPPSRAASPRSAPPIRIAEPQVGTPRGTQQARELRHPSVQPVTVPQALVAQSFTDFTEDALPPPQDFGSDVNAAGDANTSAYEDTAQPDSSGESPLEWSAETGEVPTVFQADERLEAMPEIPGEMIEAEPPLVAGRVITDSPVPEALRAALEVMLAQANPGLIPAVYQSSVSSDTLGIPNSEPRATLSAALPTFGVPEITSLNPELQPSPAVVQSAPIRSTPTLEEAAAEQARSASEPSVQEPVPEMIQKASGTKAAPENFQAPLEANEGSVGLEGNQVSSEPAAATMNPVQASPEAPAEQREPAAILGGVATPEPPIAAPPSRGRVVEEFRARPPRNLPPRALASPVEATPGLTPSASAEHASAGNEPPSATDGDNQPEVWAGRLRAAFSGQDTTGVTAQPSAPTQRPKQPIVDFGSTKTGQPVSEERNLESVNIEASSPEASDPEASKPETAVLEESTPPNPSTLRTSRSDASGLATRSLEPSDETPTALGVEALPDHDPQARSQSSLESMPAANVAVDRSASVPSQPAARTPRDWQRALMETYAPAPEPIAARAATASETFTAADSRGNAVPAPTQSRSTNRRFEANLPLQPRRFVAPISPNGRETRTAENAPVGIPNRVPSSLPIRNAPDRSGAVQPASAQPDPIRTPLEATTSLEALGTPETRLETVAEARAEALRTGEVQSDAPQSGAAQTNPTQISSAPTDSLQQAIARLDNLEESPSPTKLVGAQHRANRTHERDAPSPTEAASPAPLERVQLSGHTRRFLEPLVGFDPEHVRVFTGEAVRTATRDMGADAAAINGNILLPNAANLETPAQLGLLTHELTHVPEQVNRAQPNNAQVEAAQLEGNAESERVRSPRRFIAPLPTLAPITQDLPFTTEEDRARRAEARATRVAQSAEPPRDASRWNGLPAPWEPMPSFGQPSTDEGVISLVGAGLSPNAWGNAVSTPSDGAIPSSLAGSNTAPASAASTGGAQLAETGRELPAETGGSGSGAGGGGGEELEQLARQVYDVLKRKLMSERRREGN